MMCDGLWAIMPAGEFLNRHLDRGAALFLDDKSEPRGYSVVIRDKDREVVCKLDPTHDWLADEVRVSHDGKTALALVVSRFEMTDGRWFPAEGVSTLTYSIRGQEQIESRTFRIHAARFNALLDNQRFELPELPRGTRIVDTTTGKASIVGGEAAMRERISSFHPDAATDGATEIDVRQATSGSPDWYRILPIAVGLLSLVVVAFLKVRNR